MAKTRLTNAMRETIVSRIMADVPRVDYQALARDELTNAAVKALPQPIRSAWKDSKLSGFIHLERVYHYVNGTCTSAHVPLPRGDDGKVLPGAWEAFKARCDEHEKQNGERLALKKKLQASLSSVSNVEAFVERFPDLARYAPDPVEKVANLPATTDLIDALVAAGLPAAKAS